MALVSTPFLQPQLLVALLLTTNRYTSYAVYIGILAFYFFFIYLMFPETKRLSAEDASRVFDFDRKGRPLGTMVDVEHAESSSASESNKEKEKGASRSAAEVEGKE
jgi:hypothetical protein